MRFQHFVLTVDNRATDSTLPIVAKVRHSSCCLCSMHARWCFINIPGRAFESYMYPLYYIL